MPTYYYHEHLVELLDFVHQHYPHILDARRREFRDDFLRLSFLAQCLYSRFVNRKGVVFPRARLRYPEIHNLDAAIGELHEHGFLVALEEDDLPALLKLLTRQQLITALRARFVGLSSTMKKQALVEFAQANIGIQEQLDFLPTDGLLRMGRTDDIDFWLFLYFGQVQPGMSRFTMRDLGLVRLSDAREAYAARFQDLEEAELVFFYSRVLSSFDGSVGAAQRLVLGIDGWPDPKVASAQKLKDKLAYKLGRALERAGERYAALRSYEQGESARCSERRVRLLMSSGQREEAEDFLRRCIDAPTSSDEALFAEDFYARKFKGKRTSKLTDKLRAAKHIQVDEAFAGAPEKAAVQWYTEQGAKAFRVENSLWRTFFGLLFWDQLFANTSTAYSPFDRLPAPLQSGDFATRFADEIEDALALLGETRRLKARLLKVSVREFGKHNGVFRWRQETLDALFAMLDVLSAESMRAMLMHLVDDYKNARYGYPDLLTIGNDGVCFVEIKTDGDHLRQNQLLRIEQLQAAGIAAEIVMIDWIIDPLQDYVVVDVETTGGKGEQHRVTEIGAVRVRNQEIVERYETLLNPQRSIPPSITRLTGITPAMVAEAPYFVDIADDFARFLDGAIFVAHNVEFDYRFIRAEFQRLGRRFRMPKLCTVASMRKLYPGLSSYSLKALTATFDIDLKTHHRALCDAEAAAQLLLMINERRQENLKLDDS